MTIDFEELSRFIEMAAEKKVQISVTITPEQTEVVIEPWEAFHYNCPYGGTK